MRNHYQNGLGKGCFGLHIEAHRQASALRGSNQMLLTRTHTYTHTHTLTCRWWAHTHTRTHTLTFRWWAHTHTCTHTLTCRWWAHTKMLHTYKHAYTHKHTHKHEELLPTYTRKGCCSLYTKAYRQAGTPTHYPFPLADQSK